MEETLLNAAVAGFLIFEVCVLTTFRVKTMMAFLVLGYTLT
jgi:hypothetical protein